jgi:hypothetical protein
MRLLVVGRCVVRSYLSRMLRVGNWSCGFAQPKGGVAICHPKSWEGLRSLMSPMRPISFKGAHELSTCKVEFPALKNSAKRIQIGFKACNGDTNGKTLSGASLARVFRPLEQEPRNHTAGSPLVLSPAAAPAAFLTLVTERRLCPSTPRQDGHSRRGTHWSYLHCDSCCRCFIGSGPRCD